VRRVGRRRIGVGGRRRRWSEDGRRWVVGGRRCDADVGVGVAVGVGGEVWRRLKGRERGLDDAGEGRR